MSNFLNREFEYSPSTSSKKPKQIRITPSLSSSINGCFAGEQPKISTYQSRIAEQTFKFDYDRKPTINQEANSTSVNEHLFSHKEYRFPQVLTRAKAPDNNNLFNQYEACREDFDQKKNDYYAKQSINPTLMDRPEPEYHYGKKMYDRRRSSPGLSDSLNYQ